jgi:hypothetical protein
MMLKVTPFESSPGNPGFVVDPPFDSPGWAYRNQVWKALWGIPAGIRRRLLRHESSGSH